MKIYQIQNVIILLSLIIFFTSCKKDIPTNTSECELDYRACFTHTYTCFGTIYTWDLSENGDSFSINDTTQVTITIDDKSNNKIYIDTTLVEIDKNGFFMAGHFGNYYIYGVQFYEQGDSIDLHYHIGSLGMGTKWEYKGKKQ